MPSLNVTPIYAAACALLAVGLSVRVIRTRRRQGVALGSGGDDLVLRAVRAHGNLTEYAPLAIVMLAIVELDGAPTWFLHGAGAPLLAGRVVHAWSILGQAGPGREAGMALTFFSWGILIMGNAWAALS